MSYTSKTGLLKEKLEHKLKEAELTIIKQARKIKELEKQAMNLKEYNKYIQVEK